MIILTNLSCRARSLSNNDRLNGMLLFCFSFPLLHAGVSQSQILKYLVACRPNWWPWIKHASSFKNKQRRSRETFELKVIWRIKVAVIFEVRGFCGSKLFCIFFSTDILFDGWLVNESIYTTLPVGLYAESARLNCQPQLKCEKLRGGTCLGRSPTRQLKTVDSFANCRKINTHPHCRKIIGANMIILRFRPFVISML